MTTHVVVTSLSAHVTLRVGMLVTQFYVPRDGLRDPAYLYDNNGYGKGCLLHNLEAFPDALREDVGKAIRKYQAHFLLVGNS